MPARSNAEPVLSIVTPFFDTPPEIFEETFRCVEGQSFQRWEWIIVDDGSTRDDCRELLARCSETDPRITIIRHDRNRSVPAARNTGIRNTRCEFILQVDSDDLIEPTAAEKWLWFLTSYPEYAFVNSFHVAFGDRKYLWARGFHERGAFLTENMANPVGIARRRTFAAVGSYDETLTEGLEDWEFWIRSAASGYWGATVPEFLHWYRRKSGEAQRWANWDDDKRQKELLRRWRARHPHLREETFPRIEPAVTPESEIELETIPFANPLAKSKRRLLLIVPWLTTGGADKFNLDLVDQLGKRGWEVTIATTASGDNSWAPRFTRLTPDVFILPNLLKPADYPRFIHYLIDSRRPDAILLSNSLFAYQALPCLRRYSEDTPIVDYCHSVHPIWLDGGYPRLSVERRKHLDLQVVTSLNLKDWMVGRGADPARVDVCYIGVEQSNVDPETASRLGLAVPEDLPIIVYPCRVDLEKQPGVFAKTLLELHRRGYRFGAFVVGDGPYLGWLETFVQHNRLQERVRFLGRQPNARVRELMAEADCVFLPSQFEGISAVLYEAMAEGTAVVGADVGGQRELVTPECGILVQRGDENVEVQRYAEALARLLDDPDRRREMGRAARRRIEEHFPLDRMGEAMDSLLERAAELARSSPRVSPPREEARATALEAIREASWRTPAPEPAAERFFDYAPARLAEEPVLSIVTPFFDTPPEIFEETYRAVMRQSLQEWEWVIVDDGSRRDDCREMLDHQVAADPRIRIVRHDRNRGVPAARNTGISHARADFILQVDSDDLIEPTAAEKWLWFLTSYPEYAFVNSFHVAFGDSEYLWPRGFQDGDAFLRENRANPVGIARRSTFAAVGGFDETLTEGLEDWEFWLRCAASGIWGATLPEYLHRYRRKGGESQRWSNWDEGERQEELLRRWRRRHPQLGKKTFPRIEPVAIPEADVELETIPFENPLAKGRRRLLLILPWLTTGGADQFNLDLVDQLGRRGWEITIVTTLTGDNSWASRFTELTPDVFILQNVLKPGDYPRFLHYIIKSRQPDAVLISNSVFAYRALPYLRRHADGIPIVDYSHSVHPSWLDGGYPRLSVENREYLDLQIVSSVFLSEWMEQQGADPARIEVCYTNIDETPSNGPGVSRLGLAVPEDLPIILYPCRVDFEKQPAVFAETLRALRRRGYRFAAFVVGDGPYLDWLERFVKRYKLQDSIHFLGRQSNDRVRELMSVADCVFLPSQFEGISLSILEAMAEGVAVVGAAVGGQRELVNPDCGVLVERSDEATEVRRYTEALADLLDHPERRRAMGQAGRSRINDHFPLYRMGNVMNDLLEQARELARTSPRAVPDAQEARAAALAAIREVEWPASRPLSSSGSVAERVRQWLFVAAATIGMPIYRLSLTLGLHWVEGLRQRAVALLQPKA